MPKRTTTKRSPNEAATEARYIPVAVRRAVLARDGNVCLYCRARGDVELDHVKAHSRGGKSLVSNLVAACPTCNQIKSDWPLVLFAARLEMDGLGSADKIIARVYTRLATK